MQEQITLETEELPIVLTFIDNDNWSLLTTRRVYTVDDKKRYQVSNTDMKDVSFSLRGKTSITLMDDNTIPVFIEPGKPSMAIYNGITESIFRVKWFARTKSMGLPLVPADGIRGKKRHQ
ncbi:hypothetical protein [Chitinophaga dinghuensis]|uniref:hypothetical protein n=1 Tax=Chitinophaga dinghuensis TaxID=1539050 RepID=UPI000DBAB142|nr:hypothetical protein [Chitinophaga dinghuensis]